MPQPWLLFVESNTTGTGMLALGAARRLGYRPAFLTAAPQRYPDLARTGADVVLCDTEDLSALTRAASSLGGTIAGVTTTSEFYLAAVARLAAGLGLPGNPPETVRICRDKAAVRHAVDAAGLVQPRWALVGSADEAEEAVARVGLPCVVKPVDDSGSNNVLVATEVEQVRAQIAAVLAVRHNTRGQPMAGAALVEQYVSGPEFSVEMFSDGDARCVGVTRKTLGVPPFRVETGHLHPAELAPADETALVEHVRALLKTLGVRLGPTHTEIKLGPDGPALIEVNCRLAGGMIPELIRLARGVDLLEQQLRCAVGEEPRLEAAAGSEPAGFAGIRFVLAEAEGRLRAVTGREQASRIPGITQVAITAKPGVEVRPPRNAYDRLGYIIGSGETPSAVAAALDAAQRLVVPVLGDFEG
jgi:S-sulfo-L-cysteine synthase (3-phospho-L-serine-dependent)